MPKDYGFRHDETQPDHYVFYGISGIAERPVLNPEGDWTPYLPEPEAQSSRTQFYDSRNCVVYAIHAGYETLRRFHGFSDYPADCSDRYVGVMAGSDGGGNSPHKVLETIRTYAGVIPEEALPFSENIHSHEEYFSPRPMTADFIRLGENILRKFTHGHEWVFNDQVLPGRSVKETITAKQQLLIDALKRGPVPVSVYAWDKRGKLYKKNPKQDDNHLVLLVAADPGKSWTIFDQYDVAEGDGRSFLKQLEWDYNFDCAKILYLSRLDPSTEAQRISIMTKLVDLLRQLVLALGGRLSGLFAGLWK